MSDIFGTTNSVSNTNIVELTDLKKKTGPVWPWFSLDIESSSFSDQFVVKWRIHIPKLDNDKQRIRCTLEERDKSERVYNGCCCTSSEALP